MRCRTALRDVQLSPTCVPSTSDSKCADSEIVGIRQASWVGKKSVTDAYEAPPQSPDIDL
jgi:hypothetical protein